MALAAPSEQALLSQHLCPRDYASTSDADDTLAWRTIVERQQREIEVLRCQVAGYSCDAIDSSSASVSPLVLHQPLTLLSVLSSDVSASPRTDDRIDSDHYEALCAKLQRVRSKLVKRDVQLRRARAQTGADHAELQRAQFVHSELQTHIQSLSADVQREAAAKEQAVEHAAQTLLRCDELTAAIRRLEASEKDLRAQSLAHLARTLEAERVVRTLERDNAQQREQIAALTAERDVLTRTLETHSTRKDAFEDQLGRLEQLNAVLQAAVAHRDHQLQVQSESIRTQQEQAAQRLEAESEQHRLEVQHLRDEHVHHAAHLLQENLVLQQRVQTATRATQATQQRVCELSETVAMAAEELELLHLKDNQRRLQLRQCDADYAQLLHSHCELVRAASGMELARRDQLAALSQSKKKVGALQRALAALDTEIQQLSRAVVMNRSREQSVSRALREYGKRNRALEDVVGATRSQLRNVLDSLKASEKRKSRAVTEASALKRDLVIEQCQRSALLRQCSELESCLARCRSAATETQSRAQLLRHENSVLQDAVAQLCAYSHELVSSQQVLQRELKVLEVEGKREPCVFG